eukprot:1187485-Rhodomonas_salina.1
MSTLIARIRGRSLARVSHGCGMACVVLKERCAEAGRALACIAIVLGFIMMHHVTDGLQGSLDLKPRELQ